MSDAGMTLTPTLSLGRGSKNLVPLLLREKGLGDEGLQFNCTYLLKGEQCDEYHQNPEHPDRAIGPKVG